MHLDMHNFTHSHFDTRLNEWIAWIHAPEHQQRQHRSHDTASRDTQSNRSDTQQETCENRWWQRMTVLICCELHAESKRQARPGPEPGHSASVALLRSGVLKPEGAPQTRAYSVISVSSTKGVYFKKLLILFTSNIRQ